MIGTSSNSLGYTSSVTKTYWCHTCKKEFRKIYIENIEVQCPMCGMTFCEELEDDNSNSQNHPSHFLPYDSSASSSSGSNQSQRAFNIPNFIFTRGIRPRTTGGLLDAIIGYLTAQNYDDDFENIINQIMMNDTNKYGNPPASKQSIDKLEKVVLDKEKIAALGVENSCAVCKDEFTPGEKCLVMPCQHHFHENCLLPWLKERNSCPICRFELPTDDEDFEKRKKAERVNNTANNSH